MKRIRKMVMGIVLGMFVLASSAISCYAATNQITEDITASRVSAKFVYSEAGHQIKVTIYYKEIGPDGSITAGSVSDTQFGNVTTAVVSRNSPFGYQYIWVRILYYVDGVLAASSEEYNIE